MKTPPILKKQSFVFFVLGALLLAFYIFGLRNGMNDPFTNPDTQEAQSSSQPDRATVTGTTGCLPKKGPGPHTMECAIGIQEDGTGDWYALNLMVLQTEAGMGLDTGEHIRVEGQLIDPVTLDTDQWDSYDIVGVIIVAALAQGSEL